MRPQPALEGSIINDSLGASGAAGLLSSQSKRVSYTNDHTQFSSLPLREESERSNYCEYKISQLGTATLTNSAFCAYGEGDDVEPPQLSPSWVTPPNSESRLVPAAVKAIMVRVVSAPDTSSRPLAAVQNPAGEEKKQNFITICQSDVSSKYICLICSKAYTSRHNIRTHCNMHSGKNVHRCK